MHDILPLIESATLTIADGQFGTTSASIIATKRYIFIVPHSARIIPFLIDFLPPSHSVGPTPEALVHALRTMLSTPMITAAHVESWLRGNLQPDQVLELALLKTYKVQHGALYYKDAGAFTYDAVMLDPPAVQALADFLPSPKEAKAANPLVAASAPDLVETPGARGKGALHILIGIVIYSVGLLSVLVVPGKATIVTSVMAPVFVLGGCFRLFKGHSIDRRTGRAPGGWSSGFTLALIAGAFLGAALIWPTLELGELIHRSLQGTEALE